MLHDCFALYRKLYVKGPARPAAFRKLWIINLAGSLQNNICVDPAPLRGLTLCLLIHRFPDASRLLFSSIQRLWEAAKTIMLSIQRPQKASRVLYCFWLIERLPEASIIMLLSIQRLRNTSRTLSQAIQHFPETSGVLILCSASGRPSKFHFLSSLNAHSRFLSYSSVAPMSSESPQTKKTKL
jgi:hypothetical protein